MKVLAVNDDLCNGCGECEQICAQTFFNVPDREYSAIRIGRVGQKAFHAAFCNQCGECIAVCPTEALYRIKNGIVRLRDKDCVGCLACVGFCPDLVMYTRPDSVVPIKCIACAKCVAICPTGALSMVDAVIAPPVTELTRSIRTQTGAGSDGR